MNYFLKILYLIFVTNKVACLKERACCVCVPLFSKGAYRQPIRESSYENCLATAFFKNIVLHSSVLYESIFHSSELQKLELMKLELHAFKVDTPQLQL